MGFVFLLLVLFQIKHWIADYPAQTPYMLRKFLGGTEWILPLTAHAGVHALGTFYIAVLITTRLQLSLALAVLDFVVHFTVDRIKASPNMLGKYKPDNKYFWWALGADQSLHHITHYVIIVVIYYSMGGA